MAAPGIAIDGLKEARAAFARLPKVAHERLADATEASTRRILLGAKQRVAPHRRYGVLERFLTSSMNRRTGEGRVGLPRTTALVSLGANLSLRGGRVLGIGSGGRTKLVRPSQYGHLLEFGHARGRGKSAAPPYPFMIPAAEAERPYYLQACRRAGPLIERDLTVSRYR